MGISDAIAGRAFRQAAGVLLHPCQRIDTPTGRRGADQPDRPDRPSLFQTLDRLGVAADGGEFVIHASPVRIRRAIQPRTGNDQGPGLVFASDNVVFALLHALQKLWRTDPDASLRGIAGQSLVHGGLYRCLPPFSDATVYGFVSLHEALERVVDPDRRVYLHLCRRQGFRLRRQGTVTRLARGWLRSTSEWVADAEVMPEHVIAAGLRDLDLRVALHPEGTTHLQALLRYRSARTACWSRVVRDSGKTAVAGCETGSDMYRAERS